MFPLTNIDDITHVIQLAVAPVFLLTAIGTLLGVLTNRLGRAVDRSRVLERVVADLTNSGANPPQRGEVHAELLRLAQRIRLVYTAIVLAVLAALFICLLIAIAFVDAFLAANLAKVLGALFILAMAAMVGCLLVFLREIFLAVSSARSAIH
jgi:hypothetical protein